MDVHNKKSLLEIRRTLRIKSTKAEQIFWREVRNRNLFGLKFKRQHSIGNYIVDFYCASERLIIELDGGVHDTIEQREKDHHRDKNLLEMGFKTLRIPNDIIEHDIAKARQLISDSITKKSPLLPQGEG